MLSSATYANSIAHKSVRHPDHAGDDSEAQSRRRDGRPCARKLRGVGEREIAATAASRPVQAYPGLSRPIVAAKGTSGHQRAPYSFGQQAPRLRSWPDTTYTSCAQPPLASSCPPPMMRTPSATRRPTGRRTRTCDRRIQACVICAARRGYGHRMRWTTRPTDAGAASCRCRRRGTAPRSHDPRPQWRG